MTNKEKYRDEILEITCSGGVIAFNKRNNTMVPCKNIGCENCMFYKGDLPCWKLRKDWLDSEYKEKYLTKDDNLKVDDKVLVSDNLEKWCKRYFSHWNDDGEIDCFSNGATSWSAGGTTNWKYAKRPEEGIDVGTDD